MTELINRVDYSNMVDDINKRNFQLEEELEDLDEEEVE